jgi:hypothetical protein
MRVLIATAIVALLPVPGPTYGVTRWVGDHGFLFDFRGAATQVLNPPADNVLSARQKLPFPWKFFGEAVDGYFVSDNGYITFDPAAKVSVAASTALPSATAPRNSVFAFWTDLKMEAGHGQWANTVWAATLGRAPDRVHVIYWMSVVPAADTFATAGYNFALALYENGEFEVIFTSGRKATPVKATVGALSADGKVAAIAEGPAFDFPSVGYGGDDDVNYKFKATSTQPLSLPGLHHAQTHSR